MFGGFNHQTNAPKVLPCTFSLGGGGIVKCVLDAKIILLDWSGTFIFVSIWHNVNRPDGSLFHGSSYY